MNIQFTVSREFEDGEEIELEFDVVFTRCGIGYYEFWGARGFDRGHAEISEIVLLTNDLTPDQKAVVEKMIDNGEFDDIAWEVFERNGG